MCPLLCYIAFLLGSLMLEIGGGERERELTGMLSPGLEICLGLPTLAAPINLVQIWRKTKLQALIFFPRPSKCFFPPSLRFPLV